MLGANVLVEKVFSWPGVASYALDALLAQAMTRFDPASRNALQQDAARLAAADIAMIPLFQQVNAWASRAPITVTPRLDGRSPATDVR